MSGSVTLNGVSDEELAMIFELKSKHGASFNFNPQNMQPTNVAGSNPRPAYNNVAFNWPAQAGLKIVIELLQKIEHHRSGHHQSGAQQA